MNQKITIYESSAKLEQQEELVEMKKSDYERMMNDINEMNKYIHFLTNKTWEEHINEQKELKEIYNNPSVY